jgi:hypothetical protein
MSRQPFEDRAKVAAHVVALRLDDRELGGLDKAVKMQNDRLREFRMPPVLSRASYVRSLILRDLEALGLVEMQGSARAAAEPLTYQPPRKRPEKIGPTAWQRVLDDQVIPDDRKSHGKERSGKPRPRRTGRSR